MAMTMKIPVGGGTGEVPAANDGERFDFTQKVRAGIEGAVSRNDEVTRDAGIGHDGHEAIPALDRRHRHPRIEKQTAGFPVGLTGLENIHQPRHVSLVQADVPTRESRLWLVWAVIF